MNPKNQSAQPSPDAMALQIANFQRAMQLAEQIQAIEPTNPLFKTLFKGAISPLGGGKFAQKSHELAVRYLALQTMQQQILDKVYLPIYEGPPERALYLGMQPQLGMPLIIDRNYLNSPTLIPGPSGTGKSVASQGIIIQVVGQRIPAQIHDHKGESRNFAWNFPHAFICSEAEYPLNPWEEFTTDPEVLFLALASFLGDYKGLTDSTWSELAILMVRELAGRPYGAPAPSWLDIYELCLYFAGQSMEKRKALWLKLAGAIRSLFPFLKRAARIRHAPEVEKFFPIVVLEYQGLPVEVQEFLLNIHFIHHILRASREGHTRELRRLMVIDEAHMVFGRELVTDFGSRRISPATKFATQISSTGTGLMALIQSLWHVDPVLSASASNFISLGAANTKDLDEAAALLRLTNEEKPSLQTLRKGEALGMMSGFKKHVRVQFPNIPSGSHPTAAQLKERSDAQWAELDKEIIYSDVTLRGQGPINYIEILSHSQMSQTSQPPAAATAPIIGAAEIQFLKSIRDNPKFGTTEHYTALGMSDREGNKVKKHLIQQGHITESSCPSFSGRPKKILALTPTGRALI